MKTTAECQSLTLPSPTVDDHLTIDDLERLLVEDQVEVDRAGQAVDLQTAVDTFILDGEVGGLAAATVRWYTSLLQVMVTAFGSNKPIDSISSNDLRQYLKTLQERDTLYDGAGQRPKIAGKLAASTLNGHNRALHTFWAWCARQYKIDDPMFIVRRPKMQKSNPRAIESTDFVKLFEACGDDEAGCRNRAILSFLADAGARADEICTLRRDKLLLPNQQALVLGKGSKTRIVVYSKYTRGLLSLWLDQRLLDSEFVFTSLTTGEALSTSGLDQLLRRLKKAAGVTGRVNPHSFRHAFAREYLRAGGNVIRLAQLMGHDSVDTTAAYYAIFTGDELAAMHDDYSPVKRMMSGAKWFSLKSTGR